jgi:chemotaxis protein histidine kinase CheA
MTGSLSHATDDDDDLPDAVRQAEAAVAALARNFTEWMRADLEKALAALAKAVDSQPENAEHVHEIHEICHNIKGQGGSFGYDLITDVGGSLCNYVRDNGPASERKLKVIEAHLTAIKFILDRDIQGDGGPVGEQLRAKLRGMTDSID